MREHGKTLKANTSKVKTCDIGRFALQPHIYAFVIITIGREGFP